MHSYEDPAVRDAIAAETDKHSSEALASTSNVEIEAPSDDPLIVIRDAVREAIAAKHPDWEVGLIDIDGKAPEPVLGIVVNGIDFFIEVQES